MMKNRRFTLRFCIALTLQVWFTSVLTGQQTTVPVEHRVYNVLAKFETMQLFSSHILRVLPITRGEVLFLLQTVHKKRMHLSIADQQLLQQYIGEFTEPEAGLPPQPDGEIHAWRYYEGDARLFLDIRGQQAFEFARTVGGQPQDISETMGEGFVRGKLSKHLHFALSARNTMLVGDDNARENFDPATGRILTTVGPAAFNDQATGYVAAKSGKLWLKIGRDRLSWGSGLSEALAISKESKPFDLMQMSFTLQKVRYSSFHAKLNGIEQQRYLAGHRLDLSFSPLFQIGFYETVVYANRGEELAYINPFVVFHIIEHQLGDKDNNFFGTDFSLYIKPGLRLSGEILLDDFSFDKPIGTYWGNKLAWKFGLHWSQFAMAKTMDAGLYYSRIDPFVYTHHDSANIYSHYNESVGSKFGPNADRAGFELNWRPVRDATIRIEAHVTRKGAGDLFRAHLPEDGPFKGFMSGVVQKSRYISVGLDHQIKRDVFIGLKTSFMKITNWLNKRDNRHSSRFARFYLDINY